MDTFLKAVADRLLALYGKDMSRLVVVFPNRRAGIFFKESLARQAAHPVWAPACLSINDLFQKLSELKAVDPIEAVCRLYRLYARGEAAPESLDFFYGWGEKMLSDFNDIDKNLVDARSLFANLRDLRDIESRDFLSDEQEAALKQFFRNFSIEENSRIKQKFLAIWDRLFHLYSELRAELESEGVGYEGACWRRVVERLPEHADNMLADERTYAFVGFNYLTPSEERLFATLRDRQQAIYFWDYDQYYLAEESGQEAGRFMRRNLALFPGELPPEVFDNFRKEKAIQLISSPSESGQSQLAGPWLESNLTSDEKETAIVLCNEQLIEPVLHAMPPLVKEVNITKGYPLSHTPVFALVSNAEPDSTARIWLEGLQESVQQLASKIESSTSGADRTLALESCFQTYQIIGNFIRLVDARLLAVNPPTLKLLLLKALRSAAIPFHSEPATGVQILGLLETRCLDFKNVLILSAGEGHLPRRGSGTDSIIPYPLRAAFDLATPMHDSAVSAYHFYRLISRARQVSLAYVSSTGTASKGEVSRYVMQLMLESPHNIEQLTMASPTYLQGHQPPVIDKPADLVQSLQSISPSAINTYLRCPVMFYFQRVARLREPDPAPEVFEPNTFGTLFHRAAELLYADAKQDCGELITASYLQRLLDNTKDLHDYVNRAAADEGMKPGLVIEAVAIRYLCQLLRYDAVLAEKGPLQIVGLEAAASLPIRVPYGDTELEIVLAGNIDRMDHAIVGGRECLRIVDYKTGGMIETAKSLEDLFTPSKDHPHYMLQAFLYSLMVNATHPEIPIVPALFFVHRAAVDDFSPYLSVEGKEVMDFRPMVEEFQQRLVALLAEILDPAQPFRPTGVRDHCSKCRYAALCGEHMKKTF